MYKQIDVGQSEDEMIEELREYKVPIDYRYFQTRMGKGVLNIMDDDEQEMEEEDMTFTDAQ